MMTSELAKFIAEELKSKPVGGWQVTRMLNKGGTAVVFEATRDGVIGALKVYSKELVERDKSKHLARLHRQLELRDHNQPHLVRILDANECQETGYLFVVMELVDTPTLEDLIPDIRRDQIRKIINQIAQAAYYLHQRDLVHRDIKPSNIALSLATHDAKLLDLGVVRPVLGDTITDDSSGKRFLGTRRYAPPEFLARAEDHTPEAWQAITFYQLGAVLHDLITQRRLFDQYEGHELEQAVLFQQPTLVAADVPSDLVQLTKDCLQKDPKHRLLFVTWDRFFRGDSILAQSALVDEAKGRLSARVAKTKVTSTSASNPAQHALEMTRHLVDQAIDLSLRSICIDREVFPPLSIKKNFDSGQMVHRAHLRYEALGPVPVYVTLVVVTEILSPVAQAIRVDLACSIATAPTDSWDRPPLSNRVFAGTFDQGSIHAALLHEVPLAVDAALTAIDLGQRPPSNGELFVPRTMGEPTP